VPPPVPPAPGTLGGWCDDATRPAARSSQWWGDAVTVGPNRVVLAGAAFSLRHPSDRDDRAIWWSDEGISWARADTAGADLGGPGDQELRAAAGLCRHH
jgi:hypothetical protein